MPNADELFKRRLVFTGSERAEARINRAARLMAQDGGQRARYREDVAMLCMEHYRVHGQEVTGRLDEIFDRVLLEAMDRCDPSKGKFTHYLASLYKFRVKDAGKRAQDTNKAEISIDEKVGEDDDPSYHAVFASESARADLEGAEEPTGEQERLERLFVELLQLVVDFISRTDDSRNAKRRLYTRLFFTENIVRVTKCEPAESGCDVFKAHETGIFKTLEAPFLNSFMVAVCRTVTAIWRTRIRDGVTGGNLPDPQPEPGSPRYATWKLAGKTYIGYLANEYGERVSAAAVSQQRANYEELIGKLRERGE